nr:unnamed protein product [Callosobruchus chinensis]
MITDVEKNHRSNLLYHYDYRLQQLLEKSSDIYSEPGSTSHHPTFSRYIPKAKIRHSLVCCSYIWGAAAPTTMSVLDEVQRRATRLSGDPALTYHHDPLSHRRTVGDL